MRRWTLALFVGLAGPAWAGEAHAASIAAGAIAETRTAAEALGLPPPPAADADGQAWVAQYRLRDAMGERSLVVVRSPDCVEYRVAGEPIRVWRRMGDGIEHREIFPSEQKVVVYAPGDLRALGQLQDWARLSGLVDPAMRQQLKSADTARIAGQTVRRLRGAQGGARIELDWMPDAELPARYRRRGRQGAMLLTLLSIGRQPVDKAFTATGAYRELDYADIGDMERDSFARRHIHQGF